MTNFNDVNGGQPTTTARRFYLPFNVAWTGDRFIQFFAHDLTGLLF